MRTDGFLNLLKPPGMTSSDAVVMVRKAFPRGTKVGHMGTLDPEACGILTVGVGTATRLFDYVSDKEKTYRAEVCIGAATDTQDATGTVIERGRSVTEEEFLSVLPEFIGDIEQVPSMYSAIKVDGKKLYEAARAGQTVEVPKRVIRIDGIDYIARTGEDRFLIDVHCGRGTYIRTLCHDIGKKLGTCAHMSFLLRSKSGMFDLSTAVTPEGMQMTTRGLEKKVDLTARLKKILSMLAAMSKSAITPSFRGRMAEMEPGVRPITSLASLPTNLTVSVRISTATTEGSRMVMPLPFI